MTATKPPDFSKPFPKAKRVVVKGRTFYLPKGLSYFPIRSGYWRATVRKDAAYIPAKELKTSLVEAWRVLQSMRQKPDAQRQPGNHGKRKGPYAGISGVSFRYAKRHNGKLAVTIMVQQQLISRAAQHWHRSINLENLSQEWLDKNICEAIGIRRYYLELRAKGPVAEIQSIAAVPDEFIPTSPLVPLKAHEVIEACPYSV